MRLPGKRRLRTPKWVPSRLRDKPAEPEAEAAAPDPEPPAPPEPPSDPEPPAPESDPEPDTEASGEGDDTPSWNARMRKDELRAVAEGIGIEVQDDWTKDQIIKALEDATS